MTDLGVCYHCLTEDDEEVPAVTTLRGTALCKKCSGEYAESTSQRWTTESPHNRAGANRASLACSLLTSFVFVLLPHDPPGRLGQASATIPGDESQPLIGRRQLEVVEVGQHTLGLFDLNPGRHRLMHPGRDLVLRYLRGLDKHERGHVGKRLADDLEVGWLVIARERNTFKPPIVLPRQRIGKASTL